jgi:hypothetical protein
VRIKEHLVPIMPGGDPVPVFAKAVWPGDHRDEIIAGALVGAVVIVLGYASGLGVTPDTGADSSAAPPVSIAPTAPGPEGGEGDDGASQDPAPEGPGDDGGSALQPPADDGFGPGYEHEHEDTVGTGGGGAAGHDGHDAGHDGGHDGEQDDDGGHAGHETPGTTPPPGSPTPTTPPPTPSPSPTDPPADDDPCADGDVHLVQPLLVSAVDTLTGALDSLFGTSDDDADDTGDTDASGEPPQLCTGPLDPYAAATSGATP